MKVLNPERGIDLSQGADHLEPGPDSFADELIHARHSIQMVSGRDNEFKAGRREGRIRTGQALYRRGGDIDWTNWSKVQDRRGGIHLPHVSRSYAVTLKQFLVSDMTGHGTAQDTVDRLEFEEEWHEPNFPNPQRGCALFFVAGSGA